MSAEFSMNIERAIDRLNETTCNVSFSGYNWNNTMELLVQIEFRTEKKTPNSVLSGMNFLSRR